MNQVITGHTLNLLTVKIMEEVLNGEGSTSRNGDVMYLNNVLLELTNPRARHVHLYGRKNNIFATIAETFWVMAGHDKIDPYLSFFLPRAADYSDDGITWRGAYGPRIHEGDQVEGVVNRFKTEGLDTRRAVISIYDLQRDAGVSSKDIPCNNLLHYYVRDGELNCNAFSRSGDVVWGVTNINIFEWTFLMEHIANEIGVEVGTYSHFVTNLHIYDSVREQCENILSNYVQPLGGNSATLIFPKGVKMTKQFFDDIVDEITMFIQDPDLTYPIDNNLTNLFQGYDVATEGNLVWWYTQAIVAYASVKLGKPKDIYLPDGDFRDATLHSSFRKFGVLA